MQNTQLTIEGASCLPLLKPLWLALHDHHVATAPFKGKPRTHEESWRRRCADYANWFSEQGTFAVLAWQKREVVGYAMVREIPGDSTSWQAAAKLAELETLVVLPECRGQGIGRALVEYVVAEARRRELPELSLVVIAGNKAAISFYQANGFIPHEIQMKRKLG